MELCGASEEVAMRDSVLSVTDAYRQTKYRRALSLPVPIERCVSKGVWWTDSPHIKVRPLSRSHKGTFRNGSFPYGATISATERREIADVVAGNVEGT